MTLIGKYYEYTLNKLEVSKEEEIAFDILNDISDRSGFGNAWEAIDEDIQEEIIQNWIDIVKSKNK